MANLDRAVGDRVKLPYSDQVGVIDMIQPWGDGSRARIVWPDGSTSWALTRNLELVPNGS